MLQVSLILTSRSAESVPQICVVKFQVRKVSCFLYVDLNGLCLKSGGIVVTFYFQHSFCSDFGLLYISIGDQAE